MREAAEVHDFNIPCPRSGCTVYQGAGLCVSMQNTAGSFGFTAGVGCPELLLVMAPESPQGRTEGQTNEAESQA